MGSGAMSLSIFLMLLSSPPGLAQDVLEAVVTVASRSVSTGETVALKCVIQSNHSNWRYEWYKESNSARLQTSDRYAVNGDTLTIAGVKESDQDQYWCRGRSDEEPNSKSSSFVYLSLQDLPRSSLTVIPTRLVYTGETVTMKCKIESHSDWRYEWYKNSIHKPVLRPSERYAVNTDTLTIREVKASDKDYYWCRGRRDEKPQSSQANFAYLYVYDSPRSSLTVTPDRTVFTGERVTLKCEIESYRDWTRRNYLTYVSTNDWTYYQTPDWRYEWYKDRVMLRPSERYAVNTDTLTIRGVTASDQDYYWCRGRRDERPQSSQLSSDVYLSVTVTYTYTERAKPVLKVTPDQSVFRGERVTLRCDIQTENIQWTYSWFKDEYTFYRTSTAAAEISFRADYVSVSEYRCRGKRSDSQRSSDFSDAVKLTVSDLKPKPELTSDPEGAALTGNTVTLTCLVNLGTGWDFYWNKHTLTSETKTETNSSRVKIDSVSDGGQYRCRAGRGTPVYYTQYSDALWVNVTGHLLNINVQHDASRSDQISVFKILSFLLAACPYLLSTVVLLFKYYRERVSSAEDQSQYAVTEETST
ncbi:neural cell adhesion molecule 1-like [Puntigrus tetrazona]|uniref:neural cell adhesion molecule 1-like n=1 Tax=Puntigrus tetrazona TaxID=1606681 RepID=UPI001C89C06E|nr:neural cell adhesion molecule 1-like [Puntigrus tetrazona]